MAEKFLVLKSWLNKPNKRITNIKDGVLTMKVPPYTDCWRKTRQGTQNRVVNNAPFNWQKVCGDFSVLTCIKGNFSNEYDKAGLMIRLDEENWIFTGLEFYEGELHHSTLVSLDHTDWSLTPLDNINKDKSIWFCVKKSDDVYECYYSMDGRKWIQTRQGLFTSRLMLQVGIIGASPSGDDLKVQFEEYQCESR